MSFIDIFLMICNLLLLIIIFILNIRVVFGDVLVESMILLESELIVVIKLCMFLYIILLVNDLIWGLFGIIILKELNSFFSCLDEIGLVFFEWINKR